MKTKHVVTNILPPPIMNKLVFSLGTLLLLASCSENTYLGDQEGGQNQTGAINFGLGVNGATRADAVGADAAAKLNNKFIVSGFKGDGTTMTKVFDNYIVNWTANTAGTTESNTSDWEYVGVTAAAPSTLETGSTQTIKYWDYSTSQYDFAAYSLGTNTAITEGDPTGNKILVTSIKENMVEVEGVETYKGLTYTLKGSADDLAKCYISDMVTVAKANYQKEVQLNFRSLGSKIRVGFYETVPGYSVKDVKFYVDDTTPLDHSSGTTPVNNAKLFIPGTGTVGFGSAGTYTVTFPNYGTSNEAQISFTADASATAVKQKDFGSLIYGEKEGKEAEGNYYLARTSNAATYAGTASDNYYTNVLPTATGAVLELRVDYTLVSIDGSGETITIHGAKAFVPATYTAWLPKYAYTYIFKISDNTNGWTSTASDTDPAGLFPITFDAVVVDDVAHTQSTITTVATPSITTYQKGHDITKNEYAAGDIYVQVMNNEANPAALKNDLSSKGQLYTLSEAKTEADVMDALNIQASTGTGTITGRNGLTLTEATSDATITAITGEDGNNITVAAGSAAKFTASANTYAYVYDATTGTPTATNIYSAVNFAAGDTEPADWAGNYWDNPNGTGTAVTSFDSSSAITYYRRYTNNNKVYGVKVIKVVDATTAP